jgi:phosphonate transport system ATP-binding protein
VASLHAVDLALSCFTRIVGIREGRIAFDLPAAQVGEAQLQALYGHADRSAWPEPKACALATPPAIPPVLACR